MDTLPHALHDARGLALGQANAAALRHYERALAAWVGWRAGAEDELALALHHAPGFVMAHVLRAYLLVCSRDPARVGAARAVLASAPAGRANEQERRHLAAVAAVLDDDYPRAKALLDEALAAAPRDLPALHAALAFDHATGDVAQLRRRPQRVLHAWSPELPGHDAVLAMLAFGCVETGEPERAEQVALSALALDPRHPRALHAMAHVFDAGDRAAAGAAWLRGRIAPHGAEGDLTPHGWWHLALFDLACGDTAAALRLYDTRLRAGRPSAVADLIDASSLLWRVALAGGDPGARWPELAAAWSRHADDGFCSFNDVHAMLAFVGAREFDLATRLERALAAAAARPTRYGATTRLLGAPACRALVAYGRGDDAQASALLARLPAEAHRLGGSHAQRDVLYLTWLRSIERLRRPQRRQPSWHAAVASAPAPAFA